MTKQRKSNGTAFADRVHPYLQTVGDKAEVAMKSIKEASIRPDKVLPLMTDEEFAEFCKKRKDEEIAELKAMLQYVANNHLCATWLLERMEKHGIKYNKDEQTN